MQESKTLCKEHTGFIERFIAIEGRVTKAEDSVKRLWARLDKIMLMGFLILGGLVANLIILLYK